MPVTKQSRNKTTATKPARRGYAGRTADELRDERRSRLTATALALFCSDGYAKTTIERLCVESKVATRHFYEAFASREDLLVETFDLIVTQTQQAIAQQLNTPADSAGEQIELAIRAFVQIFLEDERRARIVTLQAVGVSEAMDKHRRETMHGFAKVIELYANSLVAAGKLPERNYRLSALALVGAANELVVEYLTAEQAPSIEQVADELVITFRALIRGAEIRRKN